MRRLRGAWSALAVPALAALLAAGGSAQDVVGWGGRVFNSAWIREPFAGISAGNGHTVARRSDGTVVAWGRNVEGQCNVPALPLKLTYVEVTAGGNHTVARRSNGTVDAWDRNVEGQCNVPGRPPGLTYVEVAAGGFHSVARRSDGSMVAWGLNNYGQCNCNTTSVAGPLPIALSVLGLPGCWLRVSPDVAIALSGASGSATFTFPIPATPALVGQSFYQQALVPDPQSGGAAFVMSDAATAVVGP